MREIGIEELKKIQLDILQEVHDYCETEGIRYFLSYGTMLGAIRHGGYIPWDDDIDIEMTRPDYMRFIQSFNGKHPYLKVLSPELDWGYYAPYANVIDTRTILHEDGISHRGEEVGIKIDIFPVDGMPSDDAKARETFRQLVHMNAALRLKRIPLMEDFSRAMGFGKIKVLGKWLFVKLIPYKLLQRRISSMATSWPFEEASYAGCWAFSWSFVRLRKEKFERYRRIKFEGREFWTLDDTHTFLQMKYGNYMQLPPEEQRVNHHRFKAWWKD